MNVTRLATPSHERPQLESSTHHTLGTRSRSSLPIDTTTATEEIGLKPIGNTVEALDDLMASTPTRGQSDIVNNWLVRNVMPSEPLVRAWLSRSKLPLADVDDLIQDAYCRISAMTSIDHVERPHAFFRQIVRNLLLNRFRRTRIVTMEGLELVEGNWARDDAPSPEQIVSDRIDIAQVSKVLDAFPERCRRIFELRRIEGLSQRETAARLGVSENVVENQVSLGLRILLRDLRAMGSDIPSTYGRRPSKSASRPARLLEA